MYATFNCSCFHESAIHMKSHTRPDAELLPPFYSFSPHVAGMKRAFRGGKRMNYAQVRHHLQFSFWPN